MSAVGLVLLLSANSLGFNTEPISLPTSRVAQLNSFEWQAISSPQYAGESIGVTILAKDESGNSYPFSGTALLSTTLGDSFVCPTYVTFSNGVCGTNVVVTLAESLGLRCSRDAASGTSNVFEVLSGMPSRLAAIMPGEQLAPGIPGGHSGWPDDQTAGNTFAFTVYLTDDWFNVIVSGDDSVSFGSDEQFAQLPAGGRLANGSGSFTACLRSAGQHNIFASPAADSSIAADTSSTVNVFPGPFENMLLVAPGETILPGDTTSSVWDTPGKSGTPNPQYLQTPFTVTVYPCDRCWNPVAGPGDTVFLRSDFPFNLAPAAVPLLDFAVFSSVQFNTAGPNQTIWAVDQATGGQSYVTWLNIRALGVALEITAPDTVRSGETAQVRVRVLDANGHPIVAALVQSSVVKGSGRMLEPALLTDTIGLAMAHFVCAPSPASEQDSIRVSSGNASEVIGIYVRHLSDSLFAFPNPFGSINRDMTQIFYNLHRASAVTVNIYDQFGNEVWSRHFNQDEPGAQYGDNIVYWDGRNSRGRRVASGIYVIQVLGTQHTGIDFKSLYRVGVVW